jgi:hypothetical protein
VNIMVKRYNTPERQARVQTYLKSLRFTSFRFGENLDASSTLTALTSEISKLSPMRPPQYRGEIHAVEHLRNAVLGETWANDVLRAMNPLTISFSEFGTNLHRALLHRDKLNAITTTHNSGHEGDSGSYHSAVWPTRCIKTRKHTENLALLDPPRRFRKVGRTAPGNASAQTDSVGTDTVAPVITR